MHPAFEQLSLLPLDSPCTLALQTARLVNRVERLALHFYPQETLQVRGELSRVELLLDAIEYHMRHGLRGFGRLK